MTHLDHKFSYRKIISHNTQLLLSYSIANMCWGQVWNGLWLEWVRWMYGVITPGNPASVSKVYVHLSNYTDHTCNTNNSADNNNNGEHWTVFIRKFHFLIFWNEIYFLFFQSNPSVPPEILIYNLSTRFCIFTVLWFWLMFTWQAGQIHLFLSFFFYYYYLFIIHNFTGHLNCVMDLQFTIPSLMCEWLEACAQMVKTHQWAFWLM